jgi:hypothetical protein
LGAIQNYLAKVTEKWIDIGVQLKLDPEYLENLKSSKKSPDKDNMRRMILTWLKGDETTPTWSALCAALRAAAVNETEIADKVEEERLSSDAPVRQNLLPAESENTSSLGKL